MRPSKGMRYQAPRGPRTVPQEQERSNAAKTRDTAFALLQLNGEMSAAQLGECLDFDVQRVRTLMHRMIQLGRVKSRLISFVGQGKGRANTRAIYRAATEDEIDAAELPQVLISTQYQKHPFKDPFHLPAAFFGPAQQERKA